MRQSCINQTKRKNTILIILIFFVVSVAICIGFYLTSFWQLSRYEVSNNKIEEPISIIICAKNESENLKNHLPKFLNQDYPLFEICLINHGSCHKTSNIILEFKKTYSFLKSINLSIDEYPTKKHAITRGIQFSQHDLLVFSDADCFPSSDQWLQLTSSSIHEKELLLGYGKYDAQNGFLNKIIRYETFHTAVLYFTFAKLGFAYMGVGRNLAYRKTLFQKAKGFESHFSILSGDDDLFIQEASEKENTEICLDKDHHTISIAAQSFKDYFYQKRRHLSAGFKYKLRFRLSLLVLNLGFSGFWLIFILSIFQHELQMLLIPLIVIKILFQYFSYWKISRTLGEKDLLWLSPFLEIIVVLYTGLVGLSLLISKQTKWK